MHLARYLVPASTARSRRLAGAAAGLALLSGLAACGGSDGESAAAPGGAPAAEAPAAGDSASSGAAGAPAAGDAGDGSTGSPAGGAPSSCDDVLALDEAAALFGEPAMFDDSLASSDEALGQLVCVWSTVEDPGDADDLAVRSLTVQLYGGGDVPAADFYAPELTYPDAEPLDLGEEAYVDVRDDAVDAVSVGWLDGDHVGLLSWSSVVMGEADDDPAAVRDAVVAVARTIHDRTS